MCFVPCLCIVRFLRICQSRKTVDIISIKCLPCGTVELMLSKPPSNTNSPQICSFLVFFVVTIAVTLFLDNVDLRYNALSFIFLQIRELSWLQWHPFSVSSSPLDGKYHLSILIKVIGEWTKKLRGNI